MFWFQRVVRFNRLDAVPVQDYIPVSSTQMNVSYQQAQEISQAGWAAVRLRSIWVLPTLLLHLRLQEKSLIPGRYFHEKQNERMRLDFWKQCKHR